MGFNGRIKRKIKISRTVDGVTLVSWEVFNNRLLGGGARGTPRFVKWPISVGCFPIADFKLQRDIGERATGEKCESAVPGQRVPAQASPW